MTGDPGGWAVVTVVGSWDGLYAVQIITNRSPDLILVSPDLSAGACRKVAHDLFERIAGEGERYDHNGVSNRQELL